MKRERCSLDDVHDAFEDSDLAGQIRAVTTFLKKEGTRRMRFAELLWMAEVTNSKRWTRVLRTVGVEDMNDIAHDETRTPWRVYKLTTTEKEIADALQPLVPGDLADRPQVHCT